MEQIGSKEIIFQPRIIMRFYKTLKYIVAGFL